MRIVIAGLLGGLVLFVWGFLVHAVLPLGNVGMHAPSNEDPVLEAMREHLPRQGLYFLPYLSPEDWSDEAKLTAWEEKTRRSPYALVIYNPDGGSQARMGGQLAIQAAAVTAGALLLSWLLSLAPWTFGRRVLVAGALGLFAWLSISLPYWNWYQFPLDFTLAVLVEQVGGWVLGGLAIAWWLGRGQHART